MMSGIILTQFLVQLFASLASGLLILFFTVYVIISLYSRRLRTFVDYNKNIFVHDNGKLFLYLCNKSPFTIMLDSHIMCQLKRFRHGTGSGSELFIAQKNNELEIEDQLIILKPGALHKIECEFIREVDINRFIELQSKLEHYLWYLLVETPSGKIHNLGKVQFSDSQSGIGTKLIWKFAGDEVSSARQYTVNRGIDENDRYIESIEITE